MSYKYPDCREPLKGDWVRFYSAGRLVIGQVEYVEKHPVLGHICLSTTEGSVSLEYVLEIRRNP